MRAIKGQTRFFLRSAALIAFGCFAVLRADAAGSGQLGILDTSGINPSTGTEWAVGDAYRLTFISSGRVDPNDDAFGPLGETATWNAMAQSFAAKSDQNLGGVSWKILGSTTNVDARNNTRTNPVVDGSGHPIMLIDGSTVIAEDYADLWDGRIRNTITMTEMRGLSIQDAEPPPFPYTGTRPNGKSHGADGALRAISGEDTIRQGQADDLGGWIDRNAIGPPAKDNIPLPIYAMSEALLVIPTGAATDEIPEASAALLIGLTGLALLRRRR